MRNHSRVLISDGGSSSCGGIQVFLEIVFKSKAAVYLNKSLKQLKSSISQYTCASISELPSNTSTMNQTHNRSMHMYCIMYIYERGEWNRVKQKKERERRREGKKERD